MTNYQIISALAIIAVCGVLYYLPKTAFWKKHISDTFPHEDPCFMCDKGSCVGCLILPVKSAYVQRLEYGKVLATCTLTFKDDFVIAQSPAGGDQKWEIPDMVGCYKTVVAKWVNNEEAPVDNRIVSFS